MFSQVRMWDTAHTASKPYNSSTPIAGQSRDGQWAISPPRVLSTPIKGPSPVTFHSSFSGHITASSPSRCPACERLSSARAFSHQPVIIQTVIRPPFYQTDFDHHHPAIPSPDMPADSAWLSGLPERSLAGSGGAWLGTE